MKKMIAFALLLTMGIIANAQNYLHLNITEIENLQTFDFCTTEYDSVLIEKEEGCNAFSWLVRLNYGETSVFTTDVLTLIPGTDTENYRVEYNSGCGINYRGFYVNFFTFPLHNPWWTDNYIWKREGESVTLYGGPYGYDTEWSTGSTNDVITVTEPGIYWVHIYNYCGELWDTIQVCNSVEIYRAGVDPATNKNKVRWNTTPSQATYVTSVKIERDGMVVGTVPYTDGEFLDNIGSENAARIYKITAIDINGNECPLPSYQFGTFNTIISPDIANPSLMNFSWEDPFIEEGSPYSVIAYRIGRFNEDTGEFIVIDQLSANVHIGKYNMDLFDGDYGIVAAVFNDAKNRDYEELAFSNRSDNEILGIGELSAPSFSLYPNPSHGEFTVEGPQTLTIFNTMGQVVATSYAENGVHTISLSSTGVYFINNGEGVVRKVVIE